uniref:Glycosyltransferase n=1 Tax=viral metagenome TaxID=1070528 RepID=A0A6M3K5L1_9ZZZZ
MKLKLALIYDNECPKLLPTAYSQTYRDMFLALHAPFEQTSHYVKDCSAKDIDADVIVIFDIHSSHHIEIEGLAKHPAVKYTYFNDPHQQEFTGRYIKGPEVHKLGAEQRTHRAIDRGVNFIICPYQEGYYEHIAPHIGPDADDMLFWFPPAPSHKRFPLRLLPLERRRHKILGNGILHGGNGAYDFREWAYSQPETFYMKHAMERPAVPKGIEYGKLLCSFAASLALCDWYVVPKYQEIPLSGCVTFAQYQMDYRDMGFRDCQNCFFVTKENYRDRALAFLNSREDDVYYQKVATEGRKLIETKWTAECFAEALYQHACNQIQRINTLTQGVEL